MPPALVTKLLEAQPTEPGLSLLGLFVFILCHRIGGVMVSVLTSSAVDPGFEPRSEQTKDYEIGSCCFSAKHAAIIKEKEQRLVCSESE